MNFKIDPHSGLADSYLDIKFEVELESAPQIEIEIFNTTTGEQLEILSVSSGYINGTTKAIVTKTNKVEGFINLFNKDKMNSNLKPYVFIDVKCKITQHNGNKTIINEYFDRFYNESMSLDAGIVPFDLVIENPVIDLTNNSPLHLHLVSDKTKKYELCIMADDQRNKCVFEVLAEEGDNEFSIPSEVIWNDCQVDRYGAAGLRVYWVKFEGIDHQRFRNRRYIPIDGTNISFNATAIEPKPQTRFGPTGSPLAEDFVLSDRYFVHTWKHFTSLGGLVETTDKRRQLYLSMFLHEYQRLSQKDKSVRLFSEKKEQHQGNLLPPESPDKRPLNTLLAAAFMPIYSEKTNMPKVASFNASQGAGQTIRKPKGKCGCSRK